MENIKIFLLKITATWFYSGYASPAPGTWGTLVGGLMYFGLHHYGILNVSELIILGLVIFGIGIPVSSYFENFFGEKDAGCIVIDEVAALWLGLSAIIVLRPYVAFDNGFQLWFAFVIYAISFRIFDIWKPWPIPFVERLLTPGVAVMLDDIIAALYALPLYYLILYGISFIW